MKKNISLLLTMAMTLSISASKKPKIEGDKNVVLLLKEIHQDFTKVEVADGLQVTISQGTSNGYSLNADANLHNSIRFDVFEGTLKIFTTNQITKSKKLAIHLTVVQLQELMIKDDAKVIGEGRFTSDQISIMGFDRSTFEMEMVTDGLDIELNQNATGTFSAIAKSSRVFLNDKSNLKGTLNTNTITVGLKDAAELDVEGDATTADYTIARASKLNARNMRAKTAELASGNTADVYVRAAQNLGVNAKGKSTIYVYGNPEIALHQLDDKAKIIKK
ncbi:Hypothetical protein I595_1509 [Croceitalea dokdonensis DOKDO 023]|uniref:Putative auto-transporter adhesin head GIN domain-containing protein n=1 Tax=Croceitalea dokdonensis DOKDO 023 TaxID=1300341 RepID=A0A0P7B3J5_9FLAO|nr:DUF2807 domain-containing protein [Croceitalea dokdonensis]KPM33082.1 Hypothetical protein I595_1509 [Croceitalea dokdonensis DOKDO 023]